MTKWRPPLFLTQNVPEDRFARNDRAASGTALQRVATAFNQVSEQRRRVVICGSQDNQGIADPGGIWSGSQAQFCFVMRTGENVSEVRAVMGLVPPYSTSSGYPSSSPAGVFMSLVDGTNTLNSPTLYHPLDLGIGTFTPSEVHWAVVSIKSTDSPALQPNTIYRGRIECVAYARIHSLTVFEVGGFPDSDNAGVCDPTNWESGKPIYDAGVQDLLQTGTELWQHNAAHLITWCGKSDHGALYTSFTDNTYRNISYSSVTTVTASSPGYRMFTQYHDSHSADIPFEVGIYALRVSGSGTLEVRLQTASGTLAEWTGISSAVGPAFTSTATIAAQNGTKFDIQCRCSDGSTTWAVYAVSLWEYEA